MIKGIIFNVKYLPATGMAIFPFIIFRKRDLPFDEIILNHERIHLQQQLELLIIPFYLIYFAEYLILRLRNNHYQSYLNISFEREAYYHQNNRSYLSSRKLFSSFKFINFKSK